jgi:hypothetical protein
MPGTGTSGSEGGHAEKDQLNWYLAAWPTLPRHLIGDRLDITGARWGLTGAEAVLKLRAVISCGDFAAYWRYHLDREHHRIHQARYQDLYTLTA